MMTTHLSEEEIQHYALEPSDLPVDPAAGSSVAPGTAPASVAPGSPGAGDPAALASAHLQTCPVCRARVADYRALFTTIRQQPRPSFGIDLAALVIAQLPAPKPRFSWRIFFVYLLVVDGAGLIAIGCYLFRKELALFFKNFSYAFGYLIATAIATIILFHCLDMYNRYQKKMRALDF